MTRTEQVLEIAAGLATCSACPQEVIDMLHAELAAIEADRQRLFEPINPDWLRARGGTSDWHMGAVSFRGPKCQIDVWSYGYVGVSDFIQSATVCSDFRTMSRGRFLALCEGCGIEVQP